jgi:hypothetical protein
MPGFDNIYLESARWYIMMCESEMFVYRNPEMWAAREAHLNIQWKLLVL